MLETHDPGLFVVAGSLLHVTPGPDILFIVGRGSAQGRRRHVGARFGRFAGLSALLAADVVPAIPAKCCKIKCSVDMNVDRMDL